MRSHQPHAGRGEMKRRRKETGSGGVGVVEEDGDGEARKGAKRQKLGAVPWH